MKLNVPDWLIHQVLDHGSADKHDHTRDSIILQKIFFGNENQRGNICTAGLVKVKPRPALGLLSV